MSFYTIITKYTNILQLMYIVVTKTCYFLLYNHVTNVFNLPAGCQDEF